MKTKKCTKCGIEKPLTAEYYYRYPMNLRFISHCRVCRSKAKAEYRQNNKEKIAEYYQNKKAEQPACVYQIVNCVNDKIYIGETTRGEIRWEQHLIDLRGNRHRNHELQADFNKFGKVVFSWSIIEEYPKDKDTLLLEEIKTIDKLLKEGKELYNLSLTIEQLQILQEEK
jgi:predicted GIY-YIG superfamily endonuclease